METIPERDKKYAIPQVPTPLKPENDILIILKKIYFWVKFLSILTIIAIIMYLISQIVNHLLD